MDGHARPLVRVDLADTSREETDDHPAVGKGEGAVVIARK
jgi:hypothetical protein